MTKLIHILLSLRVFCFFSMPAALAETWVIVPAIRSAGSGVAGDVAARARNPFGLEQGAATQVHEDTHEINSNGPVALRVAGGQGSERNAGVDAPYLRERLVQSLLGCDEEVKGGCSRKRYAL